MAEPASEGPNNVVSEARALLAQDQPADAARRLRVHLARHTGTATEYMLLGVALSQTGENLSALQAFEQATTLEPENAVAHYNLGEAYRGFGRYREALAELERALALRPDYPAASRAVAEVRAHVAPPTAAEPTATGPELPSSPTARPWHPLDAEVVDERPVASRLMAAAWLLIASPGQAINGGLDTFFNTPGAVGAVVLFFLLSVGISTTASVLTAPQGSAGTAIILTLAGLVNIVGTAAVISTFNRMTGGLGDFAGEFGSLALSFAMIEATLSFASVPLIVVAGPLGAAGFVTGVGVVIGFWKYCLSVALVMSMTEINLFTAVVLLAGARFVAQIITVVLFGALVVALLGAAQ